LVTFTYLCLISGPPKQIFDKFVTPDLAEEVLSSLGMDNWGVETVWKHRWLPGKARQ
jgi:hypothetical protein